MQSAVNVADLVRADCLSKPIDLTVADVRVDADHVFLGQFFAKVYESGKEEGLTSGYVDEPGPPAAAKTIDDPLDVRQADRSISLVSSKKTIKATIITEIIDMPVTLEVYFHPGDCAEPFLSEEKDGCQIPF